MKNTKKPAVSKTASNAEAKTPKAQSYTAPVVHDTADTPAPDSAPAKNAEATAETDEKANKAAELKCHPETLDRKLLESYSRYTWTDKEFAMVEKYWNTHPKALLKDALTFWKCMYLDDAKQRNAYIREAKEIDPMDAVRAYVAKRWAENTLLRYATVEQQCNGFTLVFTRKASGEGEYLEWGVGVQREGEEKPSHLCDVFFGEVAQKICFTDEEDVAPAPKPSNDQIEKEVAEQVKAETEAKA